MTKRVPPGHHHQIRNSQAGVASSGKTFALREISCFRGLSYFRNIIKFIPGAVKRNVPSRNVLVTFLRILRHHTISRHCSK
jgi:hypothetical protein